MNDFFKLTDEENIRLEAQRVLDLPTQYGPDYYGEFLCAWLSEDERKAVKYLVLDIVGIMPEFANNPEVNSILCEFLKLDENEEIPPEELVKKSGNRGNAVLKIMNLLFK